jgi:hypothetical protein
MKANVLQEVELSTKDESETESDTLRKSLPSVCDKLRDSIPPVHDVNMYVPIYSKLILPPYELPPSNEPILVTSDLQLRQCIPTTLMLILTDVVDPQLLRLLLSVELLKL